MRKSIKFFGLLLLVFFLSDRICYSILNIVENKVITGESVGRVNYFLKIKDSVKLLTFGSSRALHHIDVKQLDKSSYNIGSDGKKIGYVTALTHTLEKKNQLLLVHIDHNRVFDKSYTGDDALSLLNETNNNKELSYFFRDHFKEEYILSKLLKTYPYNGKVLGIINNYFNTQKEINNYGFQPIYPNESQKNIFNEMLKKNKFFMNVNIEKPLSESDKFNLFIDSIIENTKKNNSKIVFFTSPSLNIVDKDVRNHVATYFKNKNVLYLDHINFFKDFNTSDWKDYTHLSSKGATLYTLKLKDDLARHGLLDNN